MIDRQRVLLLQAPVPGAHNRVVAKPSAIPPLGLGYIASVLLKSGFEVKICDMDMEDVDISQFQKMLISFQPGVVGISTTTLTYKNGLRVAKIAKQTHPEGLVCLGGPHVSVCPEEALVYPFVDVVVQGEGEETFLELCRAVAAGKNYPLDIIGLTQRMGERTIVSPYRSRITNLDSLPFPARHLMPLSFYNIPGTVVTSRGCPFSCGFCAGPTVLGRTYTERSAENVVVEVQTCVDLFHLTSFYFVDDTMTHNTQRVLEICGGLKKIKIPLSIGRILKWTCESRADVVTPELLQEMNEAGCTTIQFGMESGSQELLNQLGKRITLEQIERAVVWSREAGIRPVLSMVFPHPAETESTLRQTFDFIRKLYDLGAEKVIPALLTLFPGTRFMNRREELGLTLWMDDTDEYNLGTPVLTTRYLDRKTIANCYTQLLMMTMEMGGFAVGGIGIEDPECGLQADKTITYKSEK